MKTTKILIGIVAIVAIYTYIFNQNELKAIDAVSVSEVQDGMKKDSEKTEAKETETGLVSFRVEKVTVNTGKNPKG